MAKLYCTKNLLHLPSIKVNTPELCNKKVYTYTLRSTTISWALKSEFTALCVSIPQQEVGNSFGQAQQTKLQ